MISRAAPHMAKSGVALKDADKGKAAKEFRTSSQAPLRLPTTAPAMPRNASPYWCLTPTHHPPTLQYFLPTTSDAVLERIDRRVMMLTRIPISHAEYIQARRTPSLPPVPHLRLSFATLRPVLPQTRPLTAASTRS